MFIIDVIKQADATGELKVLYKLIERSLGFVPAHFELFATIDFDSMKSFVQTNQKIRMHKKIDNNVLPYLRLEIAQKECRNYCVVFNTKMIETMKDVEIDKDQEFLKEKVMEAIYNPNTFGANDLSELESAGFSNEDFYDLLNYAISFMSKSKLIEVYLTKNT